MLKYSVCFLYRDTYAPLYRIWQHETTNLYVIRFGICEEASNALIALWHIKMLSLVVLHANVMETNPAQ